MLARRATQVDRQVGQSGQLGHNQHTGHSRALIDTELYKHREPGYYTNIEELRAPGDIEFRKSPSKTREVERGKARQLRAAKQKQETSLPRTSVPRTIQMIEKERHTHAPLQREMSHTTSRPQKPKRLGDRMRGIGMQGALVTLVSENAQLGNMLERQTGDLYQRTHRSHCRVHLQ